MDPDDDPLADDAPAGSCDICGVNLGAEERYEQLCDHCAFFLEMRRGGNCCPPPW